VYIDEYRIDAKAMQIPTATLVQSFALPWGDNTIPSFEYGTEANDDSGMSGTARPTGCSLLAQCLTLPYGDGLNAFQNATMPPRDPSLVGNQSSKIIDSQFFLQEKLGQLTLSQDRCYVTIAGLNQKAGADMPKSRGPNPTYGPIPVYGNNNPNVATNLWGNSNCVIDDEKQKKQQGCSALP